jgi:protoheme IX farnesyltransferase
MLGWVSGGGHLFDPRIWAVGFLFFVWQVPHFWLLLLNFGKDYEKAGFPSLTNLFAPAQLRRIIFIWIFATAATCVTLPFFGVVGSDVIRGGLFLAAFWLVWKASRLLRADHPEFSFQSVFKSINTYAFLVMLLFILDRLFQ